MIRVNPRILIAAALTLALLVSAPAYAKYARGLPSARGHSGNLVSTSGGRSGNTPGASTGDIAHKDGFDWGDAGIGAGSALVLTMLVLGGAVTVTRMRRSGRGSLQTTA